MKNIQYQWPKLILSKETELIVSYLNGEFDEQQLNNISYQKNSDELNEYIRKIVAFNRFKILSKF